MIEHLNLMLAFIFIQLLFIELRLHSLRHDLDKLIKEDKKPCQHGFDDWDECPVCGH